MELDSNSSKADLAKNFLKDCSGGKKDESRR